MSTPVDHDDNDLKTASLFYGIQMNMIDFFVFVLQNDKDFATQVVTQVRKENKQFRKYDTQDVIDDILEEANSSTYQRSRPSKSKDYQCSDDFTDWIYSGAVDRVTSFRYDNIPFTKDKPIMFGFKICPELEIECRKVTDQQNREHWEARVGKRITVFKQGKLVSTLNNDVLTYVDDRLDAALLQAHELVSSFIQ